MHYGHYGAFGQLTTGSLPGGPPPTGGGIIPPGAGTTTTGTLPSGTAQPTPYGSGLAPQGLPSDQTWSYAPIVQTIMKSASGAALFTNPSGQDELWYEYVVKQLINGGYFDAVNAVNGQAAISALAQGYAYYAAPGMTGQTGPDVMSKIQQTNQFIGMLAWLSQAMDAAHIYQAVSPPGGGFISSADLLRVIRMNTPPPAAAPPAAAGASSSLGLMLGAAAVLGVGAYLVLA